MIYFLTIIHFFYLCLSGEYESIETKKPGKNYLACKFQLRTRALKAFAKRYIRCEKSKVPSFLQSCKPDKQFQTKQEMISCLGLNGQI